MRLPLSSLPSKRNRSHGNGLEIISQERRPCWASPQYRGDTTCVHLVNGMNMSLEPSAKGSNVCAMSFSNLVGRVSKSVSSTLTCGKNVSEQWKWMLGHVDLSVSKHVPRCQTYAQELDSMSIASTLNVNAWMCLPWSCDRALLRTHTSKWEAKERKREWWRKGNRHSQISPQTYSHNSCF